MKIALTSQGKDLKAQLDQRFGRAEYIVIVDTQNEDDLTVLDNGAAAPAGGAGIAAAQRLIDAGVEALITGQLGPNALSVLKAGNMGLYQGVAGSIRHNLDLFKEGKLDELGRFVQPHAGL